jgi:hypothetical protein
MADFGVINIGMASLGCVGDGCCLKKCTESSVIGCIEKAIADHPEAKADCVYTAAYIILKNASSLEDVRRGLLRVEEVLNRAEA